MKKLINKIVLALLVTSLLSSTVFVMLAKAESEFSTTYPTNASLFVAPNPVGVGQQVSMIMWIKPDPPTAVRVFENLIISITVPADGEIEVETTLTMGPFTTDSMGVAQFVFVPSEEGTYQLVLHFPGNEFDEGIDSQKIFYEASDSVPVDLIVQEEPVSPGVPVIPGDDVTVYPDPEEPRISLHFEHITSSGTATVSETAAPPSGVAPLSRIIGLYYDFDVTFTFTGSVLVGLPYAEGLRYEQCLSMWHYEGGLVGDVNRDGKVDCRDICLIKLALGTRPGMRRWNPACDLNGDRRVNSFDLCIALRNYGGSTRTWVDVTSYVDTANNIVYGSTVNFPPFGIRYR